MSPVDRLSPAWQTLRPWVERTIPLPPTPPGTPELEDRVRGMLLGLAVGDALGNTSEGLTPAERRRRYGEIRDYLPNWWADMLSRGVPSDDTQLAFWTLESLLRRGGLDPADVAEAFAGDRIFGIGKTVTAFLLAYRGQGLPWYEAGRASAGNGALMRIAPVILPHLRNMTNELWTDVIAATVLTHRDEAAVAASVGFVGVLAECLSRPLAGASGRPPGSDAAAPPAARWWPETFLRYARPVETGIAYRRDAPVGSFDGSLCRLIEEEVLPAIDAGHAVMESAERRHSGAYLLETVPCVLHILAVHGSDPEEAIVRAVNDTQDNDTVGALVGAAVGALHGEQALPYRWRRDLLGRTREGDDGRVQGLLDRAVQAFLR